MDTGNFPLTGAAALPNATVAFPGEHWSRGKASEVIVPGEAIVPINSGGKLYHRIAEAGDDAALVSLALNTVLTPDTNTGPGSLGPNELVNQAIPVGQYVHEYRSGGFHLTLVVPDDYGPSDLIGWDVDGVRPAGKDGTGAWAKDADADIESLFQVIEWRPVGEDGEGILTVRFHNRGQF